MVPVVRRTLFASRPFAQPLPRRPCEDVQARRFSDRTTSYRSDHGEMPTHGGPLDPKPLADEPLADDDDVDDRIDDDDEVVTDQEVEAIEEDLP